MRLSLCHRRGALIRVSVPLGKDSGAAAVDFVPKEHVQHLETFWDVTTGEMASSRIQRDPVGSSGRRPGMLLNSLRCTDRPHRELLAPEVGSGEAGKPAPT